MYMENNLGFNNGDRCIEEVACAINNSYKMECTNPYESNMNYFGNCSYISYNDEEDNCYEVF